MPWPPRAGDLLPRFDEPIGVEHTLRAYCLNLSHSDGGAKANGFLTMLGITLDSTTHLEHQIRLGIATTPVSAVRFDHSGGLFARFNFRFVGLAATFIAPRR